MGKFIKRAISIACVMIMVLTAFHVMVGDASGEEIEEVGDTPAFVHRQTRITISDVAATDPAIVCDEEGVLHFAWVDHSGETLRLAYKRSVDGNDFGQDRYLTPSFVSIDHIRIAVSDGQVAIVFDALLDGEEDLQVFLLLSADSGLSWSQTYVVGRGHDPSVSISALGPVIGLTAYDGEGDSFVSMLLTASGDQLVNSIGLFRLPFGDGTGEIMVQGDLTHFAFAPSSPAGSIVYGSVDLNGTIVTGATAIRSSSGTVTELDLVAENGSLALLCSVRGEGGDTLEFASPLNGPDLWVCGTPIQQRGQPQLRIHGFVPRLLPGLVPCQ